MNFEKYKLASLLFENAIYSAPLGQTRPTEPRIENYWIEITVILRNMWDANFYGIIDEQIFEV